MMPHCLTRSWKGATRSCHHHPRTSYPDTPVKNNKNTKFVISFHFVLSISFHLISFHCVLFIDSFIHSFIHTNISWVFLPGFSERWAAELRQGFPAKALWPAAYQVRANEDDNMLYSRTWILWATYHTWGARFCSSTGITCRNPSRIHHQETSPSRSTLFYFARYRPHEADKAVRCDTRN